MNALTRTIGFGIAAGTGRVFRGFTAPVATPGFAGFLEMMEDEEAALGALGRGGAAGGRGQGRLARDRERRRRAGGRRRRAAPCAGARQPRLERTGVGIPRDELGQVFSRFFRASTATRRAIPGTGLGLAISRALVEQHGGSIALQSIEGEGTQVTVTLPAAA